MNKSILSVAIMGAALTGCAVPMEVHQHQGDELKALGAYHTAEKDAVKAEGERKIAAGKLVAATIERDLAIIEMSKAKGELVKVLE